VTPASGSPGERSPGEPPRAVLHALYALFFVVLITVLVVVGVYV
jgi:hypothetical protein